MSLHGRSAEPTTPQTDAEHVNLRLAAAIMVGSLAVEIVVDASAGGIVFISFTRLLGIGLRLALAATLWSGRPAARTFVTFGVVLGGGLAALFALMAVHLPLALSEIGWAAGLLLLLRSTSAGPARIGGVALSILGFAAYAVLQRHAMLESVPAVAVEGAWGRSAGGDHIELGFCPNGVLAERHDDGSTRRGSWKMASSHEVQLTFGSDAPATYEVSRQGDQLSMMAYPWARHERSTICDPPGP